LDSLGGRAEVAPWKLELPTDLAFPGFFQSSGVPEVPEVEELN